MEGDDYSFAFCSVLLQHWMAPAMRWKHNGGPQNRKILVGASDVL
jgi:hypothetical protein